MGGKGKGLRTNRVAAQNRKHMDYALPSNFSQGINALLFSSSIKFSFRFSV